MEIRKFTAEELGAKVLFPRTLLAGLTCEDAELMPKRQDFTVETIGEVPGMGEVRMIVQIAEPHMTFQLIEADSEKRFDDYLGTLLGMHDNPSYIKGRTDFMVLFQGSKDMVSITQENYKDRYEDICRTQEQAARWWHLYGC